MGPGEAGIQERSMKMLKKLVKENKDRAVEKKWSLQILRSNKARRGTGGIQRGRTERTGYRAVQLL